MHFTLTIPILAQEPRGILKGELDIKQMENNAATYGQCPFQTVIQLFECRVPFENVHRGTFSRHNSAVVRDICACFPRFIFIAYRRPPSDCHILRKQR